MQRRRQVAAAGGAPGVLTGHMARVDLEIDRVERIDSTRLKIDRLDRSTRL